MTQLRDYQDEQVNDIRGRFQAGDRAVLAQLATGGGKTPEVAEMIQLARFKNPSLVVWFMVPRKKLFIQGSETLSKWGIEHGRINATHQESSAFDVYMISKGTVLSRIDKIKRWPDLLFIDECHLAFEAQQRIIKKCPSYTKIIGMTATPERLDGKPLSDIYDSIVYGPPIVELTERGYLAPIRYFAPKIDGIADWKFTGHDVKEETLERTLIERGIYGDVLKYYKMHGAGKPTMAFCRSVKHAEKVAHRFREAGYTAEPIEGNTPKKKQKELIAAFESGKLDVLTSCELCTYGVDIKGARVAIHLRPTQSRAIFYQINGRVMRPDTEDCIILDHVGNIAIHGYPYDEKPWNFEGRSVRAPKKSCEMCEWFEDGDVCRRYHEPLPDYQRAMECAYYIPLKQRRLTLCNGCWQYGSMPCTNCGKDDRRTPKELEEKDAELVEMVGPVKLALQPTDERRETESRIAELTLRFTDAVKFDDSAVKEMIEIAHRSDRHVIWVYRTLHRGSTFMVNVELLDAIARNGIGKKGGPKTGRSVWGWRKYWQNELRGKK